MDEYFQQDQERQLVRESGTVRKPVPCAKDDSGKPQISLVPPAFIEAVARVREYGNNKYGEKDNWKKVSRDRYFDAYLRHTIAEMADPGGVDKESGMPHIWHAACNLAFIIQLDTSDIRTRAYENFITKK